MSPTTLVKGERAMIPRTFRQTTLPLDIFMHLFFTGIYVDARLLWQERRRRKLGCRNEVTGKINMQLRRAEWSVYVMR